MYKKVLSLILMSSQMGLSVSAWAADTTTTTTTTTTTAETTAQPTAEDNLVTSLMLAQSQDDQVQAVTTYNGAASVTGRADRLQSAFVKSGLMTDQQAGEYVLQLQSKQGAFATQATQEQDQQILGKNVATSLSSINFSGAAFSGSCALSKVVLFGGLAVFLGTLIAAVAHGPANTPARVDWDNGAANWAIYSFIGAAVGGVAANVTCHW
jgi:hypothetical protein